MFYFPPFFFKLLFLILSVFLCIGIQSAISKIDPEILKSVIASGSAMNNQMGSVDNAVNRSAITSKESFSVPSSPKTDQIFFPSLPVYVPSNR